jgi:hypothetical protein
MVDEDATVAFVVAGVDVEGREGALDVASVAAGVEPARSQGFGGEPIVGDVGEVREGAGCLPLFRRPGTRAPLWPADSRFTRRFQPQPR